MMNNLISFIKKETVLCAAGLLAILSSCFVHPDLSYISYIDYRVLALLFSLMCVMAGFQSAGLFEKLGLAMLAKTKDTRQLAAVLVSLCFFSSMLITNDVALITFVPFTIMVLSMAGQEGYMIIIIVLQTIAANLGSMLTPIGNPQNLYLYSLSGMSLADFTGTMLPYTAISFVLLLISLCFIKKSHLSMDDLTHNALPMPKHRLMLYTLLFLLCIGTVLHLLPWQLMLIMVALVLFFYDRNLFARVDYFLLLTFIFFFIFIGNMGRMAPVVAFISAMLTGYELTASILASQIISNVPAALLLSGFTDSLKPLLIGVNLGGLGTLIASLASLISYKYYVNTACSHKGHYLAVFTLLNLGFLAVLFLSAAALL